MKDLSRVIFLLLVGFLATNFVSAAEKIDINSAPLEDLVKIIHIGEARAKELISLRPFSSLDDLAKIKGIGSSRVNDIKNQGLAWVSEKEPAIEEVVEVELRPNKNLAGLGEQINLQQTSFLPLFIAVLVAVFSGIIVLALKKKLR